MAKAKPISDGSPEAALIRHCMSYAQNAAALSAAFKADPTDSTFAERISDRIYRQMKRALTDSAAIQATTMHGINAKARLVSVILKDEETNYCSDEAKAFYASFAADVKAFSDNEGNRERKAQAGKQLTS